MNYDTNSYRLLHICQILEYLLPDHFQNLPLPFQYTFGGSSETFPWTLSQQSRDSDFRFVHGYYPFFGGRSLFWSAWSPVLQPSLMRNFPDSLIKTSQNHAFWRCARELLNVCCGKTKVSYNVILICRHRIFKSFGTLVPLV